MTVTINGTTGITSPGGDVSTSLATGALTVAGNNISAVGGFQRNRIINGDMRIDQRGSATTPATVGYGVDRFSVHPITGAVTWGQVTDAPSNFINSSKWTVTSAASPAAGAYNMVRQIIEGVNIADLGWGTASAKAVTLSFWVKASITGTYGVGLINSTEDTSYVATYTVSSANTWEYKTITIPGATSGTWLTTNSNGIRCAFDLGSGTNFNGTAGAWQSGWKQRTSACVTPIATAGATFYITGVQLEAGSVATPFEHRQYGQELQLCQRYCQVYINSDTNNQRHSTTGWATGTTNVDASFLFKATMRTSPSVSIDTIGNLRLSDGAAASTPSSYAILGAVTNSNQALVAFGGSGLTTYRNYWVEGNGVALNTAKITFSAEL